MGAPGYIVLCPVGHLIAYQESRQYYPNEDWEKDHTAVCLYCGLKAKYSFAHYDGTITDFSTVKVLAHFSTKGPQNVRIEQYIIDPNSVEPYNVIKI